LIFIGLLKVAEGHIQKKANQETKALHHNFVYSEKNEGVCFLIPKSRNLNLLNYCYFQIKIQKYADLSVDSDLLYKFAPEKITKLFL